MTPPNQNQQILTQISSLAISFAAHVSGEIETKEKITAMYKILVTGNGILPLPEIVRNHTEWIKEREEERCNEQIEKRDNITQNRKDTREDRTEAVAFKRQLWILAAGQVLTFLLLGLAVLFKWK